MFKKNSVTMYGYGTLGKHLIKELEGTDVSLEYIIDRQGTRLDSDLPICGLHAGLKPVDAVVVTITFEVEEIKRELRENGFQTIVTIEELVAEAQ